MRAIIKNNKVINIVHGNATEGLPLERMYEVLKPTKFYHLSVPTYEILKTKVKENRIVTPFDINYCKSLVKEELRSQRADLIAGGFEFEGNNYHSDNDSLVMIQLLPAVVPAFKHKNGWTSFENTTNFKLAGEAHVQNYYGLEAMESTKVDAMETFEEVVEYYNLITEVKNDEE